MDAYHLVATHPQVLAAWVTTTRKLTSSATLEGDHAGRHAKPAPELEARPRRDRGQHLQAWRKGRGRQFRREDHRQFGPIGRGSMRQTIGDPADDLCDTEVTDCILSHGLPELPSLPGLQFHRVAFQTL